MVSISHARTLAIQKLNNIVFFHLNNRPNIINDKWKHNTTQDWEFFAKNFDDVTNELIANGNLLRLDIHISALGNLEERRPCFIKVTKDNNEELDLNAKEKPMVSDSEKETIKKRALRKKKRNARIASLEISCLPSCLPVHEFLSPSTSAVPGSSAPSASVMPVPGLFAPSAPAVPGSSTPSASAIRVPGLSALSVSAVPVPGLSAPSISAVLVPRLFAPSPSAMPVPGLSTLSASAMPVPGSSVPSASAMPVPGLFAPSPSALPVPGLFAPSASAMPVPRSSAPSASAVPMLGLSAPSASAVPVPVLSALFPILLSQQTPTLVPRKRRLGQYNRIIKKASLKKAAPTFASLLLPVERPSRLLLPSSSIGEKRLFDMVFNLDCQSLANDHTGEDVNLSFLFCQCPPAVKANWPWQRKLLDQKAVCMVEAIPLAAAIFRDPNFVLYTWHTLKLAKKLGLKTKNLKNDLVKERIGQIWANKTMARLDKLFANNPDWWHSTAVIFSQSTLKNKKK